MSWNYRVIRRVEAQHASLEPVFVIGEVYYRDDGSLSYSADAMWPCGASLADLRVDLERMLEAFARPVMDERADNTLVELDPDDPVLAHATPADEK